MLVKKSQAVEKTNSGGCIVWEYPVPGALFSHATALIRGRYPDSGEAVNRECEELYYVISGRGVIYSERGEFAIEAGDVYFFEKAEAFHVVGEELFVALTNAPPWTPEQYSIVA